jgi:hypothetical protein
MNEVIDSVRLGGVLGVQEGALVSQIECATGWSGTDGEGAVAL